MYSQHDEEKYITEYFKNKKGNFLDIGAYDGKTFSNVLKLIQSGWGGVLIEPSPSVIPLLKKRHGNKKNIKILEYAVGLETKEVKFYDSKGDAVSSCNKQHKIKWEKGSKVKFKEVTVSMLSLDDLFKKIDFDFDFINIDIEGNSVEVFENMPFKKLINVKMFCVEYDDELQKVTEIGRENGFESIYAKNGNIILVRIK